MKEKILFVLVLLFFTAIIFPTNDILTGFIIGGMMLTCLLIGKPREKWVLLKQRKSILWMFLFFAWVFFSVLLSHDKGRGFTELDSRLPILYFPLTVGLTKLNRAFRDKVLSGFAVVVTAFCLLSLLRGIYYYRKTGIADSIYSDGLTFYADRSAVYISVLVNFSIFIFSRSIFYGVSKKRFLLIPVTVFLLLMAFLLAGRNMLFVLALTIGGFFLYYTITQKKYKTGMVLLAGVILLGFVSIRLFPKTLNRFTDLSYFHYEFSHEGTESSYTKPTTADQWNGANFRLAAWNCGWELFTEHPVAGVFLGDKKEMLTRKYEEKNFQFAVKNYKNVHNNYLDILYSTGIIGGILFLVGWIGMPLQRSFRRRDYLAVLIIATYAIAMITEVYFDRSFGGMLFGFMVPFLLAGQAGGEDQELSLK